MNYEELTEYLALGFHTGFRKATDAPQAHPIWKLIQEMDNREWHHVIKFVADPLAEQLGIEVPQ